jgi:hypothetical protein
MYNDAPSDIQEIKYLVYDSVNDTMPYGAPAFRVVNVGFTNDPANKDSRAQFTLKLLSITSRTEFEAVGSIYSGNPIEHTEVKGHGKKVTLPVEYNFKEYSTPLFFAIIPTAQQSIVVNYTILHVLSAKNKVQPSLSIEILQKKVAGLMFFTYPEALANSNVTITVNIDSLYDYAYIDGVAIYLSNDAALEFPNPQHYDQVVKDMASMRYAKLVINKVVKEAGPVHFGVYLTANTDKYFKVDVKVDATSL